MHSLLVTREALEPVQGSHLPFSRADSGRAAEGQNNGGETAVCCLAECMLGTKDDSCNEERDEDMGEKWIGGQWYILSYD